MRIAGIPFLEDLGVGRTCGVLRQRWRVCRSALQAASATPGKAPGSIRGRASA